jgi:ABC-2 type transport system ATP-binding protein
VSAPGAAVVCTGLTKHYGSVHALESLDLEVPRGSVFGFLGPNGAGKTTTLRLLTGLGHPTRGRAWVAGVEVGRAGPEAGRSFGYLDQDPRFYGWMKGRELLGLVADLHGLRGPSRSTRIDEALGIVGLADAGRRRIGGYSGGMRQRIGLAAALLARPPVLFLDEPVSSLDPAGRHDILDVIGGLRASTTVVMSTHILNDVERVCDRVGILDRGRLVTEAPIEELLERHAAPIYQVEPEPGQDAAVGALAGRLRAESWTTAVEHEHGFLRVHVADPAHAGPALLRALADSGIGVIAFERQRPTLEDVFLGLVGPNGRGTAGDTVPAVGAPGEPPAMDASGEPPAVDASGEPPADRAGSNADGAGPHADGAEPDADGAGPTVAGGAA